jgi:hypothetical protein
MPGRERVSTGCRASLYLQGVVYFYNTQTREKIVVFVADTREKIVVFVAIGLRVLPLPWSCTR